MKKLLSTTKLPSTFFDSRDEFLMSFDSMFDDMFSHAFPGFQEEFGVTFFGKNSYPKCDIIDFPDKIKMTFEISGVDKENLSIDVKELQNDVDSTKKCLTISGNKTKKNEEYDKNNFIKREIKNSSFKRSFSLGNTIDSDNIDAEFKDGILTIELLKKSQIPIDTEETKKIEIK